MTAHSDTDRLHGTWALTSWERFRAGVFLEHPLGAQARGLITYEPSGFVQVQLIALGRTFDTFRNPRDAANAALRGEAPSPVAAAEVLHAYSSFAGYAGRFEVHEAEQLIRHHVWTGIDPRMVDGVQERLYRFVNDDTLILQIRPYQVEGVEHSDTLLWHRLSSIPPRVQDGEQPPQGKES